MVLSCLENSYEARRLVIANTEGKSLVLAKPNQRKRSKRSNSTVNPQAFVKTMISSRPVCAWFLEIIFILPKYVCVHVCVCVCVCVHVRVCVCPPRGHK